MIQHRKVIAVLLFFHSVQKAYDIYKNINL